MGIIKKQRHQREAGTDCMDGKRKVLKNQNSRRNQIMEICPLSHRGRVSQMLFMEEQEPGGYKNFSSQGKT